MNYSQLNTFRYRFENKENGQITYFDMPCYGNIWDQINNYKKDMKSMCLLNVSNETHEIIEVIHLFNGKTIYKNGKYFLEN